MTQKVTCCLITYNEADNVRACLESVAWADEMVVVDSGSTDDTAAICRELGARVIIQDWPGHVIQKNRAVDSASHDWVFCIDADERVTPALAEEIKAVLGQSEGPGCAGYTVPRLTRYLGRWIRHASWYPDRKLRLFDRRLGRFTGKDPHDRVEVTGSTGQFKGDLLHYSYRDIAHHVAQINRYTTTMAQLKFQAGKGLPILRMLLWPPAKFFKMYCLRLGWLDGRAGFVASCMGAYYEFLKYAKLFELILTKRHEDTPPDQQS